MERCFVYLLWSVPRTCAHDTAGVRSFQQTIIMEVACSAAFPTENSENYIFPLRRIAFPTKKKQIPRKEKKFYKIYCYTRRFRKHPAKSPAYNTCQRFSQTWRSNNNVRITRVGVRNYFKSPAAIGTIWTCTYRYLGIFPFDMAWYKMCGHLHQAWQEICLPEH